MFRPINNGMYVDEEVMLWHRQREINERKKTMYNNVMIRPKQPDWYKITSQKTYRGMPVITRPRWGC